MEYAIFKTGGKQYKASKGEVLELDKLIGEENKSIFFENVLLYVSDGQIKLGNPSISGFKVKAKILKQKKGDKITVSKFKAKARYRKKIGFRLLLTEVLIEDLVSGAKASKPTKSVKVMKS